MVKSLVFVVVNFPTCSPIWLPEFKIVTEFQTHSHLSVPVTRVAWIQGCLKMSHAKMSHAKTSIIGREYVELSCIIFWSPHDGFLTINHTASLTPLNKSDLMFHVHSFSWIFIIPMNKWRWIVHCQPRLWQWKNQFPTKMHFFGGEAWYFMTISNHMVIQLQNEVRMCTCIIVDHWIYCHDKRCYSFDSCKRNLCRKWYLLYKFQSV